MAVTQPDQTLFRQKAKNGSPFLSRETQAVSLKKEHPGRPFRASKTRERLRKPTMNNSKL